MLRRNDNYVLNPRMSVTKQRRNPAPEQRMRFVNVDNQQRQRVLGQPTQNTIILDEPYNEQMVEPENDCLPEEVFEFVQTDGCETSMYIFEEDEEYPISQENVVQTRAHVNKAKNKENFEKDNEKESNKSKIDSTEVRKQKTTLNPLKMIYNVVEYLSKLRITLPFIEVVKIPQ
jgi:hypothetical protein